MILSILHTLKTKRIVLASGSPRRRELLQKLGLEFEVEPSSYDESLLDPKDFPSLAGFVEALAYEKAAEVARRLDRSVDAPELVIGADTVVTQDGQVYGKPADKHDAAATLSRFSGRSHHVYTGVAILRRMDHRRWTTHRFSAVTAVTMDTLTPDMIHAYVVTGESMDKAGSYGIQGVGASFISSIDGCFYNVMGLPLHLLSRQLYQMYGSKDGSSER